MKSCNKVTVRLFLVISLLTMLWGNIAFASQMELPEGLTEAEGEAVGAFAQVTEATKGYERADKNSRVIAELEQGRKLMMLLKTDSEWCQVMDEGQMMYVQMACIEELPVDKGLAAELQGLEEKRASEAEYDLQVRRKTEQGRIWGIVIAALIAGVFITGIVAVVRSGREEAEKKAAALDGKEELSVESLDEDGK